MLKTFKYPKKYIGHGVWTIDWDRGPIKRKISEVSGSFVQINDAGVPVTLFRPAYVYLEGSLSSVPAPSVFMTKAECLQVMEDNAVKMSEDSFARSCEYAEQSARWKNVVEKIQKRRNKKGKENE